MPTIFSKHSIVGQSFSHHSFCSPLRAPSPEISRTLADWLIKHTVIFFQLPNDESFLTFGDDQNPRCLTVNAVHNSRPWGGGFWNMDSRFWIRIHGRKIILLPALNPESCPPERPLSLSREGILIPT